MVHKLANKINIIECATKGKTHTTRLLGAGVLGDGLGALRHGVLGQLTREQQADSSLDLAGRDGRLLVVLGQARGLAGNALEDVVDERVHDRHGLGGHTGVGVHLLQDLVDVDRVRLFAALAAVALGSRGGLGLAGLLLSLLRCFRRHGVIGANSCVLRGNESLEKLKIEMYSNRRGVGLGSVLERRSE